MRVVYSRLINRLRRFNLATTNASGVKLNRRIKNAANWHAVVKDTVTSVLKNFLKNGHLLNSQTARRDNMDLEMISPKWMLSMIYEGN